jgi:DNA-binding beta-propeller fold protein YncE
VEFDEAKRLLDEIKSALAEYDLGNVPLAAAFDGTSIWVTNFLDNNVTKLRVSDGSNPGTFPPGQHPAGIAFDGGTMWVANQSDGTASRL